MKLPPNTEVRSYGAEALVRLTPEIRALLTKKDKFGGEYVLYRQDNPTQDYAYVPRGLVNRNDADIVDVSYRPCPPIKPSAPPQTDDQAQVIADCLDLLRKGVDHVVEAPTGFGKSYVGSVVAGALGQKTLIVVTKNDLVLSWQETLTQFMGQKHNQIGHVQQNVLRYKDCQYTVAMIHTLVGREYDPEFYSAFGLIIFDEAHRLGAEYFSQACSKFNAAHRLALSATPDRSDGKEIVFHAHIGPIMVKGTWVPMKPKVLVLKTGCKLPNAHSRDEATGKWVYGPMKVVPGRMANVNKALAENHSRNMEIVRFVKQAFDAGRTIVLMSDLLEGHLTPLFHLITAAGISGEDIGYYHGQIKKQDLNHNKKRRIVLATYQMCSEGTNVVEWDTLVMVTPRSKVKQPIGRVMRFKQGKKTPVILELVDDNDVLKTFHFSRLKQYYEVHAEIINL